MYKVKSALDALRELAALNSENFGDYLLRFRIVVARKFLAEFIDERIKIHTRIYDIAILRIAEKLRMEKLFVKLVDRGKLLPFEVVCRSIGAVRAALRFCGNTAVLRGTLNVRCRFRAVGGRRSCGGRSLRGGCVVLRAPRVIGGLYAIVVRNIAAVLHFAVLFGRLAAFCRRNILFGDFFARNFKIYFFDDRRI